MKHTSDTGVLILMETFCCFNGSETLLFAAVSGTYRADEHKLPILKKTHSKTKAFHTSTSSIIEY